MIEIICDRCGERVREATKVYLDFWPFGSGNKQLPTEKTVQPRYDFCNSCRVWLDDAVQPPVAKKKVAQ